MNKYIVAIIGIVAVIGSFLFGSAYATKAAQERFAVDASAQKAIVAVLLDGHMLGSLVVTGDYGITSFEGQSKEDALAIGSKLPKKSTGVLNLRSQCKESPIT